MSRTRSEIPGHASTRRSSCPLSFLLAEHELYGTGTTGGLLEAELGLEVWRFQSGAPGG